MTRKQILLVLLVLSGVVAISATATMARRECRRSHPDELLSEMGAIASHTGNNPTAAVAASSAAPPSASSAKDDPAMLRFPDGSRLPPLNGVADPPAAMWPEEVPFSPVTGTLVDKWGNEWYAHADGSRSTTLLRWREDLGRLDPWTIVANPVPVAPVEPDDPRTGSRQD